MSTMEEPDVQPSLSMGSQECFEIECEPCGERGNFIKAEGYCIVCKEFMCSNCIMFHKSMRMSKGHMIQGPDEMPKAKTSNEDDNASLASQDEPMLFCKSHKKEIIKYFCKDHKSVCCVDCVTLSHRSCANILLVNEVCNDDATSSELKQFFQRLDGVADDFRNLLEMTERNRIEIEKNREKLLQDVRMYKEYIFETITKLVNGIERKIEGKVKDDQVKTDQLADCCSTIQKYIKATSNEFESLQNSNRKSDEFILMNQSKTMLDEWERNKLDMATNTHLSHDAFCPSLKLRRILREIKEIGLLVEETDAEQCEACKTMALKTSMQSLACGHSTCEVCVLDGTESKRTCHVCGAVTVTCSRCKTAVDQSKVSALACQHEVCLTCRNQMIAHRSPCADCGVITVKCKRCQTTVDQTSISVLACGHDVCLLCRKQQTEKEAPCTDCGLITGNQPEGSFNVDKDGFYMSIRFTIPDGKQKSYHPRPGEAYQGQTLTCNLFNDETGKQICHMLKTAFDRKLVCKIEHDKISPNIELYNRPVFFDDEYEVYTRRVTERLKQLGITQ